MLVVEDEETQKAESPEEEGEGKSMEESPEEKEVVAIEETNSACSELSTKASEVKDAGKISKSSTEIAEAVPPFKVPLEPIAVPDNSPKKNESMGSQQCPILIDEVSCVE